MADREISSLDWLSNTVEAFEKTLSEAVTISGGAIGIEHTGRQNRALFIFAKLIAHCMTISVLIEKFHNGPEGGKLLNHFSIGALGRTVIDAALMVMYISEPSLKKDEWDLRRQVLFLHDLTNRKRFLVAMGKASGQNEFGFFENYDEIKSDLRKKIKSLGKKLGHSQDKISSWISGQKVFLEGSRGAAREAGWDVDAFEFQQSYLSNWVHSHPVSFIRANEHGISLSYPSEFQLGFCAMVISNCKEYLEAANARMRQFTGKMEADPIGQLD